MLLGGRSNLGHCARSRLERKRRCEMTNRQLLTEMLAELSDERLDELLDFAKYLAWKNDRASWQQFGQSQFAKVYGDDEPEYTEDDLLRNDES
jgi:hypothetical protein